METHGISFDERLDLKINDKIGSNDRSEWVREACWLRIFAEAELGKRAIHFDSWEKTTDFLLDRLEDGLDEWNA